MKILMLSRIGVVLMAFAVSDLRAQELILNANFVEKYRVSNMQNYTGAFFSLPALRAVVGWRTIQFGLEINGPVIYPTTYVFNDPLTEHARFSEEFREFAYGFVVRAGAIKDKYGNYIAIAPFISGSACSVSTTKAIRLSDSIGSAANYENSDLPSSLMVTLSGGSVIHIYRKWCAVTELTVSRQNHPTKAYGVRFESDNEMSSIWSLGLSLGISYDISF